MDVECLIICGRDLTIMDVLLQLYAYMQAPLSLTAREMLGPGVQPSLDAAYTSRIGAETNSGNASAGRGEGYRRIDLVTNLFGFRGLKLRRGANDDGMAIELYLGLTV